MSEYKSLYGDKERVVNGVIHLANELKGRADPLTAVSADCFFQVATQIILHLNDRYYKELDDHNEDTLKRLRGELPRAGI